MNKSDETTLVVQRMIKASPLTIFEALTKESLLREWFYPSGQGFSVEVNFNPTDEIQGHEEGRKELL